MHTTPVPAPDIAALFDHGGVVAHELVGPGDESLLHPDEARRISRATERRRQEFAAGRMCARAGLEALGLATDRPLGMAEDRSPIWAEDVTGSISHTAGYCVAVVAPSPTPASATVGLGIDAEQLGRVTENLHRIVFTPDERAWLSELPTAERADDATTLFSAKEAFYKAQHPLTRSWVGFQDVTAVRSATGLVLHPATDLDALHRVTWPQSVAVVRRGDIVVTAVEVRTS
jgi:4'-phosphopantetheinyl transferase EntD